MVLYLEAFFVQSRFINCHEPVVVLTAIAFCILSPQHDYLVFTAGCTSQHLATGESEISEQFTLLGHVYIVIIGGYLSKCSMLKSRKRLDVFQVYTCISYICIRYIIVPLYGY